MGSIALKL